MSKNNKTSDNKTNNFDKRSLRIDRELLSRAIAGGWINSLAFFYLLKLSFKNSRIYKPGDPIGRIASISGTSKRTIFRRFKTLKAHDLLTEDEGAYILKTNPKRGFSKLIYVSENPGITEIGRLLMLNPLRKIAHQQAKYKNIRKFIEPKVRKQNSRTCMAKDTAASLSVRYVAKVLKISVGSAFTLMAHLESIGAINVRRQDPERLGRAIVNNMPDYLEGISYGHRYVQDGYLFEVYPARVEFRLQPVKVRAITLKSWKRMSKDPEIRSFVNKIYAVTNFEQYTFSA